MSLIKKLMESAEQETESTRDVKQTCLAFSKLLGQLEYGNDTLHQLVDEVYEEIPEIEDDIFWRHVNEDFGALIVSGLIVDTLADILQENFNIHFNRTDLEFENMGDIFNFLVNEPGKICAGLPKDVTVGDIYEVFIRATRETFGQENRYDSDINIFDLVSEGMRDMVLEGHVDLDLVLEGTKLEDFIYEYMVPVLENSGATAFHIYQTDDNVQNENNGEDESEK